MTFHYDPLDYVLSGLTLSGATLTMQGGVAIGVYGVNGIKLGAGAKLNSYGSPASLNRLVRYQAVQEIPAVWGATGSTMDVLEVMTATTPLPEVRMQFTDVSVMSDTSSRRQFICNSLFTQFKLLALTDCTLRGCVLDLGTRVHSFYCGGCETTTVALTNCLWLRAYLGSSQGGGGDQTPWNTFLYNNLFVGGAVNLDNEGGSGTWAVYDNLFDTVNLGSSGTCPNGYNGYKSTTALSGGSNNKTLSTCDYAGGPLGDYYYSTTGGSGHLSDLIDAGSRTAAAAKLDDHTTRTDQVADSGTVDIGFHYKTLVEAGVSDWVFTDRGFIDGMQNGALRSYNNPNDVAASPWSFQSADKSSLRISFENDYNCSSPPHNPYTQEGTAVATLWITTPTRMTVAWSGVGETEDSNYEKMSLFVECGLVGSAHAPGGGLGCGGGMAPVVSDPSPPQYIDLQPGLHFLRIETTTNDALFNNGAYYQFALSFEAL